MPEDTPAAAYVRKSNDRTGAGVGVKKQLDDCRELAAKTGCSIVVVREDNDTTAAKESKRYKARPGWEELLEDLRSGRVQAVLSWHSDRLLRDMGDLEDYIRACSITESGDGIPTYFVRSGRYDFSTSQGRMLARITAAVQQQEVEHMIERQRSAKERIRNAGGWHGGRPVFGFTFGVPISRGGNGGLVQVPAEADAIRWACDKVLRDGIRTELGEIARAWNAVRVRPGFGTFHTTSVKRILMAPRIAGLVAYKGQVIREGNWEPIVSADTWRAVCAILTDRKRRGVTDNPGPAPNHLLSGSGILVCGVCGGDRFASITQMPKGKPPYRTYMCRSLTYASKEDVAALGFARYHLARSAAKLDAYVDERVRLMLAEPDIVAAFAVAPEIDTKALRSELGDIDGELDAIAGSAFPFRQKDIAAAPLLVRRAEIERDLAAAEKRAPVPEFDAGADPVDVYDAMPVERKRAVIRRLMRVRVNQAGQAGAGRFRYDTIEFLPPDSSP